MGIKEVVLGILPTVYKRRSKFTTSASILGLYLGMMHLFWRHELIVHTCVQPLPSWMFSLFWVLQFVLYFLSSVGVFLCFLSLGWSVYVCTIVWRKAWHPKRHVNNPVTRSRYAEIRAKLVQGIQSLRLWLLSGTWLTIISETYHFLHKDTYWSTPLENLHPNLFWLKEVPFTIWVLFVVWHWFFPLSTQAKEIHDVYLGQESILNK